MWMGKHVYSVQTPMTHNATTKNKQLSSAEVWHTPYVLAQPCSIVNSDTSLSGKSNEHIGKPKSSQQLQKDAGANCTLAH